MPGVEFDKPVLKAFNRSDQITPDEEGRKFWERIC